MRGYALFDTAIGRCGIAWSASGITGLQLPEASDAQTRRRLARRHVGAREGEPPPGVRKVAEDIVALLHGQDVDLSRVTLDSEGVPPFHRRVYEAARQVPPGQTVTYGELAQRVGSPGSARAVGQAMGKNPFPIVVPCHRVVAAGGRIGGFSAEGGVSTKRRMLGIERGGAYAFDPELALEHLTAADRKLARVIGEVGAFRMEIEASASLFDALSKAIIYQQLSGKAAATIHARVKGLFRAPMTSERLLRTSTERLRSAGLSGSKVLSLQDLARRAKDGSLPTLKAVHRMGDDAVVEALTEVRGIGRWSAEMLLMFNLGRANVLPLGDYGIQKGFQRVFAKKELPSAAEIEARGKRWAPYRTAASWYLWRALELDA